jgi:hypothetical protein
MPVETLLFIIILTLASHRVTRFITRDKIPLIALPRKKFTDRWAGYDDAPVGMHNVVAADPDKTTNLLMRSLVKLWECDWCVGVWVSAILTGVSSQFVEIPWDHWFGWTLVSLAVASGVGLIAELEPDEKN